jgi:aldose 1-epimerase
MNATARVWLALCLMAVGLACDTVKKDEGAELAQKETGSAPAASGVARTMASLPLPTSVKAAFGKTKDGRDIDLFTLTNGSGTEVKITNYGGYIVAIKTKDKAGKLDDITLGFDELSGYQGPNPFFGCVAGRYANRIANGQFKLGDQTYTLAKNNGPNSLHGGVEGFNRKLWTAKEVSKDGATGVEMSYVSKDGEEGYPGNLTVTMTYWLNNNNEVKIDYAATTDKETVLNLANHTYFNLAGQGSGDILKHEIMIAADKFTPVNDTLIPTGELKPVAGTPFDFTQPMTIGARIDDQKDQQIVFGKGYDHNYVLSKPAGTMGLAARVTEASSGRVLEVSTDQPGVQFYTGNFLDGSLKGKGGKTYPKRSGFCLETQHFPDSPNHPEFPTTTLKPGEQFKSSTVFKFSVQSL